MWTGNKSEESILFKGSSVTPEHLTSDLRGQWLRCHEKYRAEYWALFSKFGRECGQKNKGFFSLLNTSIHTFLKKDVSFAAF